MMQTAAELVMARTDRSAGDAAPSQMLRVPLLRPQPPRLSQHLPELCALEESGIYSNYGPVNSLLEQELVERIFGTGSCVTVCNATIGLMLAMREVMETCGTSGRRYALMPSFTFVAAAQAALWCGLTPLFCDIDAETWMADEAREQELLERYAGEIAVVVPYATFGNDLDLGRYLHLAREHGVPVVVDAAASLGSRSRDGQAFGAGFPWPVVFSMHATKVFSVGEGGLIYAADPARIERLRRMGSFGFGGERSATGLGLNSKMCEITALVARLQLRDVEADLAERESIAALYVQALRGSFELQRETGHRQARAFFPVLLPRELAAARGRIMDEMRELRIGTGTYFSPHAAEQPFVKAQSQSGPLPVTADVAARMLSLPLWNGMSREHVQAVLEALVGAVERAAVPARVRPTARARVQIPGRVKAA